MLKLHVVVGGESKTGTHDVDNGATLSEDSIDNGSTTRNTRSFEHVWNERKDRVKGFPLFCSGFLHGYAFAEFTKNDEIVNQWRDQKGVLTGIVHDDCILPANKNLRRARVVHALFLDEVISVTVQIAQYVERFVIGTSHASSC